MRVTGDGMRRAAPLLAPGMVALGTAACGSGAPKAASSTGASSGSKTAFCNADIDLDRAGSSASSMQAFLTVLKNHPADLSALKNDAPAAVRSQAQTLVAAADQAMARNDPSGLDTAATSNAGGAVDTFCGVDGSGKPLPSYFGAGKGSAFCSVEAQINQATTTAQGPQQILAFLSSHQDLVNQFSTDSASLPAAQKAEAQQLVSTARTAISSNDATPLGSDATISASTDLSVYCGQNS